MAETLGTIRGQMILDVKQALAAYTSARQAHVSTITALNTGAGALTAAGAGIAAVGVAMGAGILVAVDAAATFEKRLDYFGAVSNATQAEYDALREKALQLGADTAFSANQIADSFVELGKSGVGAQQIIDGIGEAVASLGSAADIPLDTAANIIMAAVQTFQLASEDAVGVADRLAGAANASIVSVEDLGTSLKYAGGTASALGIPFEDLNTAIALLGQYGIRGSTAGTSLRTMLLGLTGSTKPAQRALRELGILTEDGSNKFYTAEGSAKSLSEIFQILHEATAGLSDQQRVSALEAIFQNRALASAIALTTEGAAGFEKMSAAIEKTTAADVAAKRLDNLSGDIEILKGNLDTLAISAGSSVQEFARSVVQGVTQIIQTFIDLPASVQGNILVFISVVAVILTLIGVFGMFAGAIMNMIALAMQLSIIFPGVAAAIKAVTIAVKAFTLALLTNPVFLIIAAIVALIAALVWFFTQTEVGKQAWSSFMRFLSEAWTNISTVAVAIWEGIANFFSDVWTNITNFFQTAMAVIQVLIMAFDPIGFFTTVWGNILNFFVTLWTNVTTSIANFITGAITFFASLPAKIVEFFMQLPSMVGYALGFLLGTMVRWVMEAINWAITNVPLIINAIVTFFQELPIKIAVFLLQAMINMGTWIVNMVTAAQTFAADIMTAVLTFLINLPVQVATWFSNAYNAVVTWLTNMVTSARELAARIVLNIVTFLMQLPQKAQEFFGNMAEAARAGLAKAVQWCITMATQMVTGIRDGIAGIPGTVTSILNKAIDAIKGLVTRAFNAVRDFASGLWEGFKDGLGIHSPSYIEHAMWAITDVLDDETQRMKKQVRTIQNLGNGMTEMGTNMGFNFGTQLDKDLITLQDQLSSAKSMQDSLTSGSIGSGSLGVESTQAAAIAAMSDSIAGLKEVVGDTYGDIIIQNPEPETASESLPRTIRKLSFIS